LEKSRERRDSCGVDDEQRRERERAMSAGILFAFVGRGRTVWAEHQANMTFQNPQKTAAQMLAKLSQEGKYTFQLSEARTAYCLVDHLGVTFGCVASSTGMSSTSAMVFLGDLQEQFYCQFSTQEVQTCAENTTQFRRFSVTMKKAIDIAYSGGSEKISEVKKQIEDTRQIMSTNIDKVLERGERLDDVMDKSEAMKNTADAFRKKGKELRRKMWWQNTKMKIIIAAVVLLLIVILFFSICGGVACVT